MKKNESSDGRICNRHSCPEKESLKKCKFCNKFFCKEHIMAFSPYVGIDERVDSISGDNGHPCPAYVMYKVNEEKRKEKEYMMGLDKLLGHKHKEKDDFISPNNYGNNNAYYGEELTIDDKPIKKNFQKKINHRQYKKKNNIYHGEELTIDDKAIRKKTLDNFNNNKKRKKKETSKNFLIFGLILVCFLFFSGYLFYNSINSQEIPREIIVDNNSLMILDYINSYRLKMNSADLLYSEDMYYFVKDLAEKKDVDPESFEDYFEFKKELDSKYNLSQIRFAYYKTYFISGGGVEGFKKEFNKEIGARNIIKDKKYEKIAIYCSLDNCILYAYNGEINSWISNNVSANLLNEKISKTVLDSGETLLPKFFENDNCDIIEEHALNQDLSEGKFKKNFCGAICGEKNLEYNKYKCDRNNIFHCYCKESLNE